MCHYTGTSSASSGPSLRSVAVPLRHEPPAAISLKPREVLRRGLEGFVGKDPASTYRSGGRTRSWLKSKVRQEGTFVVGGIVWRAEGWSLLVGSPEGNELRYRGLVHFGVGRKLANALIANGLVRSTSPFADKVPLKGVTWLDPRLTAEISYAEIMPGGKLRAGVFRGFTAV